MTEDDFDFLDELLTDSKDRRFFGLAKTKKAKFAEGLLLASIPRLVRAARALQQREDRK